MILRLLLGRGAFRGSAQVMQFALVAVWGTLNYGPFANALGACAWLVFVPTAAEKSALKVIPRANATRDAIAGLSLRFAAAPVLLVVLALLGGLVIAPDSPATLYLAAACWHACTGLLMTVSGLNRLQGKPSLDALAFGAGAVLVVGATLATWLGGWSPRTLLLVLVAGLGVLVLAAVLRLPTAWVRPEPVRRRGLLPAFGRTTWLLGVSELFDAFSVSLVFLVLAASGRVSDSGPFYLALMSSSVFCSFLLYQLKLHQPRTSARLRGEGAAHGRARAASLMRAAERAGLAFAVLLAAGLALPPVREVLLADAGLTVWLVLGVLVLIEMAMAITLIYATYLLENTNSRILTSTSAAAVVRLAATAALAIALVPPLGAVGGFAAITLALSVEAWSLRRMLLRHHPELHPPATSRTADPTPTP
ncbi:hypothetical protein CFN78_02285 [Amycolatopsis antarctica]|uniref:Polysaccharide biosynthesis protein C-terminal domain-containing protein n=2 Tax=Amycolatopsis antarctica TaxID=1854586 RepID=A0A263D9Z1_9PSEU|nr:hypothetical protein CFN78_02285 [Amycolatopsis antarctica]